MTPREQAVEWAARVRACTACPCAVDTIGAPLPSRGSLTATVLVLGSAPGPEDAKVGKAWQSGEAVEEVRVWLAHLGLSDPHKVWWSYLTRCPMKRTIKAAEVKACRPFLEQELAFLPDVRVILPLGAVARKAILGAADAVAMTEPSEAVVEHAGRQLHVYPLPSPNYFARSPEERRYHLASVLPEVKKALQTLGVV